MPKVLFAGGRLDSLTFTSGVTENTTATTFDTTYCDAAVLCGATGQTWTATQVDAAFAAYDLVNGETGYYHMELYHQSNGTVADIVILADSLLQPWFTLRNLSAGSWGAFYNSGTGAVPVYTQVGANFTVAGGTKFTIDIKFDKNSAGTHAFDVFINNTSVRSGTFTAASLAIRNLRGSCNNTSNWFSQIMITEGRSTINSKVKYNRPSAAGANVAWTGAFTDVNEAVNSDATVNSSATAAQRQTYAMQDITLPSASHSIQGIWQWVRAKNDGAAPANIKLTVRISAVNYDTAANIAGVGVGFSNSGARWDVDPSTAAAWGTTNWNAAEAGYLSAT